MELTFCCRILPLSRCLVGAATVAQLLMRALNSGRCFLPVCPNTPEQPSHSEGGDALSPEEKGGNEWTQHQGRQAGGGGPGAM